MRPGFVSLGDLCSVHDDRRLTLTLEQCLRRPGRYPYHCREFAGRYVDDYSFEGEGFLLGAAYDVCTPDHGFNARHVSGKSLVSHDYHIIVAIDAVETPYIERMLRYTEAKYFIDRNPFVDRLEAEQIPGIQIHWLPDAEARAAFVRQVDTYDELRATQRKLIDAIEDVGVAIMRRLMASEEYELVALSKLAHIEMGRRIAETRVNPVAGYPLFSPVAEIGRADGACVPGRTVILGVARGGLDVRWTQAPAWVTQTMGYLIAEEPDMQAFLYFGLLSCEQPRLSGILTPETADTLLVPRFSRTVCIDVERTFSRLLERRYHALRTLEKLRLFERMFLASVGNGVELGGKNSIA